MATKIGVSIKNCNSAELSRADLIAGLIWAKVRQLTGRSENSSTANQVVGITASTLNSHYAII
jgi:hypothetical protein